MTTELPMFPLGIVPFPGLDLPLHVFEPRYRRLVADVLGSDRVFGIVLIEQGSEVGGGDTRFGTGTAVEVAEAVPLEDGRWILDTRAITRIHVRRWLPDDPYPRADVDVARDPPLSPEDLLELQYAEQAVRRALALQTELSLDRPCAPATFELPAEPRLAAWLLAAHAPISVLDQQKLIEVDEPAPRLRLLRRLADEVSDSWLHEVGGSG